jgi:hypothetical protein
MGWLLSEGTVLVMVAVGLLLATSRRCRRPFRRAAHVAARTPERLGFRTVAAPPPGRPIEVVAREARRLGRRYRATRRGVSFAKSEAVRRAYDDVLAEGCEALGITHLLGVLPTGEERDAERARVERLLHLWGLDLDDAA